MTPISADHEPPVYADNIVYVFNIDHDKLTKTLIVHKTKQSHCYGAVLCDTMVSRKCILRIHWDKQVEVR